MLAVAVSRADEASVHIGEQLRALADWTTTTDDSRADADGGGTVYRTEGVELREFDALHLELDDAAQAFDSPDVLVFASRHAGETAELLTAHHTGNFGPAEHGGADGQFARAAPNAHRAVVAALSEHAPDEYAVGMECTHHGPTDVGVPSLFVEVGSAEPQWRDPAAARAVARAILDIRGVEPDSPAADGQRRQLAGFGGGHYAPRFERVVRETDWAVGHVGADWCLDALSVSDLDDAAVIERAVTASRADYALLEGDRPELTAVLEGLGCRVVDETFVRETTGVSLGLVAELEGALGAVDEGLRFGDPARGGVEAWSQTQLPDALLAEATGIDAEAVLSWVRDNAVAFGTEQSGTVVTGPLALPDSTTREDAVDTLADVLRQRYDSAEREDGALCARQRQFDPELAETLGIPEGPKYGRLSNGEAVEVDGREIEPETVHAERTTRFPL